MDRFWRDRRVLVTGHTGFKGSWLSLWLQRLGAKVTGLSLPPDARPNLFEEARVADGIDSLAGDMRDVAVVRDAVRRADPEVVLHLAAQSLVRTSYAQPVETYATNVLGTIHLLEAVRGHGGVRAVVVVTTDKCYENREWPWGYRENDVLGGHDPYSSSKACAELVTDAYRRSFFERDGAAIATARAGNVIGGGDWAVDRLVPDLVRAFGAGRPAAIRNPASTRPWQHVLDPLAGYLELARRLHDDGAAFAQAWNFGPDDEPRRVQDVVERAVALWGDGARWMPDAGTHPHETRALRLDVSKAKSLLGWRPRWGVDEALERTIGWYRARHAGGSPRELALAQIGDYESAARR